MSSALGFRGSLQLLKKPCASSLLSQPSAMPAISSRCLDIRRPSLPFFSTSSTRPAKPATSNKLASSRSAPGKGAKGGRGGKRKGAVERDPKAVNMLKQFALLSPRRIPPPLRMGRNRYLRHWTIHRAWLLFRRKERERREGDLMRQFQGMQAACEELRLTDGPGSRGEGYLYRVAMEKKGIYGYNGFPIEYARPQTDSPAREPWNHDWKRS